MCSFSVWNRKMCIEQSYVLLMFSYMIEIYKNHKIYIWVLVSLSRHKDIISRHVNIKVVQHTVIKTPTWTKMRILVVSETHIPRWQQIAHNSSIIHFLLKTLPYKSFVLSRRTFDLIWISHQKSIFGGNGVMSVRPRR